MQLTQEIFLRILRHTPASARIRAVLIKGFQKTSKQKLPLNGEQLPRSLQLPSNPSFPAENWRTSPFQLARREKWLQL